MVNTFVSKAIAHAKAAHEQGQLSGYKPLALAGADQRKSTTMTSWGPAMRR